MKATLLLALLLSQQDEATTSCLATVVIEAPVTAESLPDGGTESSAPGQVQTVDGVSHVE